MHSPPSEVVGMMDDVDIERGQPCENIFHFPIRFQKIYINRFEFQIILNIFKNILFRKAFHH